jgi:hypothetical protein
MKTRHTKSFLVALVGSLLITSCQKETSAYNPPPGNNNASGLKQIDKNAANSLSLFYSGNQVTGIKLVDNGAVSECHFTYNAQGKPGNATLGQYKLKFIYSGPQLTKVEFTDTVANPAKVYSYTTFTYNSSQLSQSIMYVDQGNRYLPSFKTDYTYHANGNIQSISNYFLAAAPDVFALTDKAEYEYDDKQNPLLVPKEILYLLYLNHTPQNIIEELRYDEGGLLEETRRYLYQYNVAGWVTEARETIVYRSQGVVTNTLIYRYQ